MILIRTLVSFSLCVCSFWNSNFKPRYLTTMTLSEGQRSEDICFLRNGSGGAAWFALHIAAIPLLGLPLLLLFWFFIVSKRFSVRMSCLWRLRLTNCWYSVSYWMHCWMNETGAEQRQTLHWSFISNSVAIGIMVTDISDLMALVIKLVAEGKKKNPVQLIWVQITSIGFVQWYDDAISVK